MKAHATYEQQCSYFESRTGQCLTRERANAHNQPSILEDNSTKNYDTPCSDVAKRWTNAMRSTRCYVRLTEPASSHRSVLPASRLVSLSSTVDDSVFYSQQHEEILQTARGLCRDYICYRLKRSGYQGRVVITKYEPAKDQLLSFDVLNIGKILEDLHPQLFRNLARQLGYVLRSDEELRVLFQRLGKQIIGPDLGECRWGRILALLAVAGSLSVDCIAQGHSELIENIVTIFCDFIEMNLLTWVVEHGGWDGMAKTFAEQKRSKVEGISPGGLGYLLSVVSIVILVAAIFLTLGSIKGFFVL